MSLRLKISNKLITTGCRDVALSNKKSFAKINIESLNALTSVAVRLEVNVFVPKYRTVLVKTIGKTFHGFVVIVNIFLFVIIGFFFLCFLPYSVL